VHFTALLLPSLLKLILEQPGNGMKVNFLFKHFLEGKHFLFTF